MGFLRSKILAAGLLLNVLIGSFAFVSESAVAACPETIGSPLHYAGCTEAKINATGVAQQITIATPAGTTVGDLLVAGVAINESHIVNSTIPAGWTIQSTNTSATNNGSASLSVLWKIAGAGDLGNHTFVDVPTGGGSGQTPNANEHYGWMMTFKNVQGVSNSAVDVGNNDDPTAPATTTTAIGSVVLRMFGYDNTVQGANFDNSPLFTSGSYTTITHDNSNNTAGTAVSGAAAFTIQAAVGSTNTITMNDIGSNERWIGSTLAIAPLPTEFRISHAGTGDTCNPTAVTIQATFSNGVVNTNFTGTVNISTDTVSGDWAVNTGAGGFSPGPGNGTATYTFVPGDSGQVILDFSDTNNGPVNFDLASGSVVENASFDPDLSLAACAPPPTAGALQCISDQTGNIASPAALATPARATNPNRMVVLMWSGEGNINVNAVTGATFNGANMTRIARAYADEFNNDTTTEMWVMLDAQMPEFAGNYTATLTSTDGGGGQRNYAVCATVLTNVEQIVPMGNGTGLPVNITASAADPSGPNISTTITASEDSSLVFSVTGNGASGSYTLDAQLTELFDDQIDGAGGATIAIGSSTLASSGSFSVTNTSSANPNNRHSQILAAFSPAPVLMGPEFRITHAGTGTACSVNSITITAYDNGLVDTTFSGTVDITVDTGNGSWSDSGGMGTLITGAGGTASYTFAPGDLGTVTLDYFNSVIETVNFDLDSGGITESVGEDPDLIISDCVPTVGPLQCTTANQSGTSATTPAISVPSQATNANRMVVLVWSGEGNISANNPPGVDAPAATFAGQNMTRVTQAWTEEGNNDNTVEIWAILDADLPTAAGNYTATLNYPYNDGNGQKGYTVCALLLTDVEQAIPLGDGTGLPVNVTENAAPGNGSITTSITTTADNSVLISGTGNGSNGNYNLDGQLTELLDTNIAAGGGSVFAIGSTIVASQGSVSITNTASVTPNRQSHALAAFAPLQPSAVQFSIIHATTGALCGMNVITVAAINMGGIIDSTYTDTITIDDNGAGGTWSVISGNPANFSDLGGGVATYNYELGDGGQVQLGYTPASIATVNFDVTDGALSEGGGIYDLNMDFADCILKITHDGNADTCTPETITFGIYDVSDNPVTDWTGTINISTSTLKGVWSVPVSGDTPLGTLTELGSANDGAVSYTFVESDNGEIDLVYSNDSVEITNINAVGAGVTSDNSDTDLTIVTCYFTIAYADAMNTTDVCSLEAVTITAVNGSGAARTDYNGLISLSTDVLAGTWSVDAGSPPAGTFNDPLANDGAASYQFDGSEGGVVTLYFNNPESGVVDINVSDGLDDEGSGASDPVLTVTDCTFMIESFYVDNALNMTACTTDTITVTVLDRNAAVAADFTGLVSLTTNTNHGDWVASVSNGTLINGASGDGQSTYEFDAADNGVAVLSFRNENEEIVNIDIDFNGSVEDAGFDPDIEILACIPDIDASCYQLTDPGAIKTQPAAVTMPSSGLTGASRMLLVYVDSESTIPTSTVTLINGATSYPMSPVYQETNIGNGGNTMDVFGILDADLDTAEVTYDVQINGSANNPAICVVSLEGVEQTLPVPAVPATDGPVNGNDGNGVQVASTTITTEENNAVVISAVATGQDFSTYSSSLANSLWDGSDADPNGAEFFGNWDYQSTAGPVTVDETNSFFSPNVWTHIVLSVNPIVVGDPYVEGYVPVVLSQTYAGNVNYRAIGNTLRSQSNAGNACAMTGSSASILTLPSTVSEPNPTIVAAYLFYAGSGTTADIDSTVTFGPTGSEVSVTAEDIYQIEGAYDIAGVDYFGGYAEVTGLIVPIASQEYTLSGLTVDNGAPWSTYSACTSGWGLVVVYEHSAEYLNVINLFQGFQPFRYSSFTLVPRNFRVAEPDILSLAPHGQITHLTFEGDDPPPAGMDSIDEGMSLQDDPGTLTFAKLVNPVNTTTSQYNSTVTFPDYVLNGGTGFFDFAGTYTTQSTTSYGTDVDTYYVQGATNDGSFPAQEEILYEFGNQKAEQITTLYGAGQDGVLLMGEFISVTNAPLADLEVFINETGTFKVNSSGTGSYQYTVTNNGNGAVSGGYADGVVIFTANLPAGMTATAVTADGWTCDYDAAFPNTNAYTCKFDIAANYTFALGATTAGQLKAGETLPAIDVTIAVGDETNFPLLNNNAIHSARIAHFFDDDCDYTGISIGEQPDPTACTRADQFDNVNDLNKNTIDIDDIDEKQANNNNVEQITSLVSGIRTNLGVVKDVVGVLQDGETAVYSITVTNYGPDATTDGVDITVTDTFPSGVIPLTTAGSDPEWSCLIASQNLACARSDSLANGESTTILVNTDNLVSPAIEGAFVTNTATVQSSTYNFDTVLANNSDTDSTEVVGDVVASNELILISVSEAASIGINTLAFEPGDLILYDPINDTAEMFLDESAVGATLTDIDAVHLLPNGQILMSTTTDSSSIGGVTFDAEDIVLYDPILDTATLVFDGSTVFADGANANIDAIYVNYNDSYDTNDWDILLSTSESEAIGGTSFEDNDFVTYDVSAGTATVTVNGNDGAVFGDANGDIDAAYIRYPGAAGSGNYIFSTDDLNEVIAAEPFTADDLVEFDGVDASIVFEGDQPFGVFDPASASRRLNAVHLVESGYYGHFAVITNNGSVCEAPTITIEKHAGLGHTLDANYEGTIRITASHGSGTWSVFAASGTLIDAVPGDGIATYTFVAGDGGSVDFLLTDTIESLDVNIDVTNGIVKEDGGEDSDFDINLSVTPVTYLDQFSVVAYNNNDGVASFASNWIETFDDGDPATGKVRVTSGRARFNNFGGGQPEIVRTVDFSSYTVNDPPVLSFTWERGVVGTGDSFQVQVRGNDSDPWTTLEDFTGVAGSGSGTRAFSFTEAPYNITLSDTTQFRFRVNSGYSINSSLYFFIDNVEVTTETNDCNIGSTVDHYAITHSGSAIACLAENITITAHSISDLPIEPGMGVQINLSTDTGKGTWNSPIDGIGDFSSVTGSGNATYTFAAGESSVTFPFNYTNLATDPEAVTIMVSEALTPTRTQLENQTLTVAQAGLRFYNETDSSTTYPGLIAGRPSNNAGQPYVLVVQAIQTSTDNPNQCLPMFDAGQDVSIDLGLECGDPFNCGAGGDVMQVVSLNSVDTVIDAQNVAPVNAGNSLVYTPTTLRFETQSGLSGDIGARIALSFPDVGSMQMSGRYDIPFNNGAGTQSGSYMVGSTNTFVVRPFGLDVDFGDDRRNNIDLSYSLNAFGSAFDAAGDLIATTVKAVSWQFADDQLDVAGNPGPDGIPDFEADLSDNPVTDNFGSEAGFAYDVQLSIITALPGGGDNLPVPGPEAVMGILTQTGDMFSSFAGGVSSGTNNISFNEVGIYDVKARLVVEGTATPVDNNSATPANYLNFENVEGGAANVGRITPSYYDLTLPVIFNPRPNFASGASATFTYMDEAFNVQMELQAMRVGGGTPLQNYFGDFAKLTDANELGNQLTFFALEDLPGQADVNHNSRIAQVPGSFPDDFGADWSAGVATINGDLIFSRAAGGVPDGPLTIQVAFNALDSDGITDEETRDINIDDGTDEGLDFTYHSVLEHEFRYGRMRLENASGSEIPDLDDSNIPIGEDLGLHIVAEYWDGTRFIANEDDDHTTYSGDELSAVAGSYTDGLDDGELIIPMGQTGTIDAGVTNESESTAQPIYFQAPGEGNDGGVIVELDLGALGLEFLTFDWRKPADLEDEEPDGLYTDSPRALIEFGVFQGNNRIINWQEILQ